MNGVIKVTTEKILLPNGFYIEKEYERSLIMSAEYSERYKEFIMNDTREAVVLIYIIMNMNEDNELICSFSEISEGLKKKGTSYSLASVARAIKMLKEKYSDLVTIGKFHGVSKFMIDKKKCFKA